jgi:hypothetical protein
MAKRDTIDFITIASAGNATDFGNLTAARDSGGGSISSPTRGLFYAGNTGSRVNVIEFITIASAGNGSDFGDLDTGYVNIAGASSHQRGLIAGGFNAADAAVNTIQFVTIATTGNAADFGDLLATTHSHTGDSNQHGGIA